MHNLILAILCSVAVSVLLKIARKKILLLNKLSHSTTSQPLLLVISYSNLILKA